MLETIEPYVDKIIIDKNDWKKIEKYRHEQCPNSQNEWNKNGKFDSKMFFPLNTFVLDIDYGKGRKKGLVELENYSPVNFKFTDELGVYTFKRKYLQGFEMNFNPHEEVMNKNIEVHKDYFNILCIYITSVMIYIIDKAEERRRFERISPQEERKQREEYEYKDRELFFLNDIIQYRKIHRHKSSLQYRCECWGVRGHIRHTKYGVQFVHPYKKGKKRNILEPKSKTYLLNAPQAPITIENETGDRITIIE